MDSKRFYYPYTGVCYYQFHGVRGMAEEFVFWLRAIIILADIVLVILILAGILQIPEWQDFKDRIKVLWKRFVK